MRYGNNNIKINNIKTLVQFDVFVTTQAKMLIMPSLISNILSNLTCIDGLFNQLPKETINTG
jgi:hypothetical protein